MWPRIGIAITIYAAVTLASVLLAPQLYVLLPYGRAPSVLLNGVMSLLGPGVGSLDIHSWPFWVGGGVLITLPWFLAYAATAKRWLSGLGAACWLVVGAIFATLLA